MYHPKPMYTKDGKPWELIIVEQDGETISFGDADFYRRNGMKPTSIRYIVLIAEEWLLEVMLDMAFGTKKQRDEVAKILMGAMDIPWTLYNN